MHSIQQALTANQTMMAQLINLFALKLEEDEEEDINEPQPLVKIENVCQALEDIDNYPTHQKSTYRLPLAYVTWNQVGFS